MLTAHKNLPLKFNSAVGFDFFADLRRLFKYFVKGAVLRFNSKLLGKKVNIYVNCQNCSLSSGTSPIQSSSGKTETITLTYDSSTTDWSGIYSDSSCTNKLSDTTSYTFLVGDNDIYLYAKAILKQQIYVKENGSWVGYSEVYVKENGVWVKKEDYTGIFDTSKKYNRIEV